MLASPFFDRYDDHHQDGSREDHEDDDHQGGVEKDYVFFLLRVRTDFVLTLTSFLIVSNS